VADALDGTVEALRQRVGDSLVALDIWESASALSLAGFGMPPATGPMLHRVTEDLRKTATLAGSLLDDYHVLTVTGGVVVVVTRPHLSGRAPPDSRRPAGVGAERRDPRRTRGIGRRVGLIARDGFLGWPGPDWSEPAGPQRICHIALGDTWLGASWGAHGSAAPSILCLRRRKHRIETRCMNRR